MKFQDFKMLPVPAKVFHRTVFVDLDDLKISDAATNGFKR